MDTQEERWVSDPSMKVHGKNILKCIKDDPLRSSDYITFMFL